MIQMYCAECKLSSDKFRKAMFVLRGFSLCADHAQHELKLMRQEFERIRAEKAQIEAEAKAALEVKPETAPPVPG